VSIIYDRKEIRSRMRDDPMAKPQPVIGPDPENGNWICMACGFWDNRPKGSACPICGKQE
jgi:rubrerythrin